MINPHPSISQYIEYGNGLGVCQEVQNWLRTTLNNYLYKNTPTVTEIEHIIDYLAQNTVKKVNQMSYEQALVKANKWTTELQKKAEKIEEKPEDIKIVLDFKDGFKIVQLIGENAYKREGYLMRHCVASYYGNDTKIYSLRDNNNNPHATLEDGVQIKGKGNGSIHPKYIEYVVKFLEFTGMSVRDSEMLNLGYINIEKYKEHLHKDNKFFKEKYWYKQDVLLDKDGKEFASLDLLDQIPLIDSTTLKINFKLDVFIPLSIEFLFKQIKNIKNIVNKDKVASSGYNAQVASSGNYAQVASSGNYAQVASSGYNAQVASSGYNAQVASSGNYAQVASSGNYAQVASSGNYAQVASSGYNAQVASSGNYAQVASSGYNAQVASSGNYAQVASSGNYAQVASSGNYAQVASSGYNAKVEVDGKDNVAANIGYNGMLKAVVGTWITLAEYDEKGKPLCVKSARVDGKELKEGVWYMLKGGQFTEVNDL